VIFEASSSCPSGPRAGRSADSASVIVQDGQPVDISTAYQVTVLRVCKLQSGLRRARKAATIRVIPLKEAILRALLACQAQNRTTIPSKSGDGSHTLRLTDTATASQIFRLERELLTTNWVNIRFLEVICTAVTGRR
jgi:hypothetical protein